MAAARGAVQRLPHRRRRDPHLPAPARRRPRPAGRARRGLRPPDPVPPRLAAARPRGRRGRGGAPRAASGPTARSRSTRSPTAYGLPVDVADDPSWLEEWRDADRETSRALDRLLADEPDLTPHEVAGAVSRALPPRGPAGRRRLEPDPRPRPDGRAATRSAGAARSSPTAASPASTGRSPRRSAPPSAGRGRRARSR